MTLLRIDLEKHHGDFSLKISEQLHIDTVLGVLGHNGAGKTTLLRLLAGLDRIERGVLNLATVPGWIPRATSSCPPTSGASAWFFKMHACFLILRWQAI